MMANRLIIAAVLWLWLLDWLSKASERICRAQQFHADWNFGIMTLVVAIFIALMIGMFNSYGQRARSLFALDADWEKLLATNRLLYCLSCAYLIASCSLLISISAFFATCCFDNGAKTIACVLSDFGQYEFAERVYRCAPDLDHKKVSGRCSTMATWHSSSFYEDPGMVELKNAAVAKVYGSESREMAGRYFFLGLTFGRGPEDHDQEAIYWHTKAFSLYERNHAVTKSVDTLAQLAVLQHSSNKSETRRLTAQAVRLVPSLDETPYFCTSIIQFLARQNGDAGQAELFRRGFEKFKPASDDEPSWVIGVLLLLGIFGSGVGRTLAKEMAINRLAALESQKCSKAGSQVAVLESLQKRVTLKLIGNNLREAEILSLSLLSMAAGYKVSSLCEVSEGSKRKRMASILVYELFCGVFGAALVVSFCV